MNSTKKLNIEEEPNALANEKKKQIKIYHESTGYRSARKRK